MSIRTLSLPLILAACTLRPYDYLDGATTEAAATGDAASSTSTTSSTTTGSPTTTGGTTTTTGTTTGVLSASTSSSTDATTQTFIPIPDASGEPACDPWINDCPEEQKCTPASLDGDNSWETAICSPIPRDPDGLYESCTVVGSGVSGIDSCDVHMMCWDVVDGVGTCIGQCLGSPDQPHCADPSATCSGGRGGPLNICFPSCDPIAQDCSGGDLCIPNPQNYDSFICVLDASGEEGQAFDLCEYANACDSGLVCLGPELATECDPMALGCCTPFCDTSLPNTCAGQDQECIAWYEMGQAPPGYENVGVCGIQP